MKLYKLDLLTLLISLFILSACQNTDSIGLDVDPSTGISGTFIDTVTVRSSTVREDSILTNTLTQYPLGYFNDPIFGKTAANIALSLTMVNSNTTFGTAPVLDSAVLVLHYGDEFYGDSTSKFQIEVRQLADQLNKSKAYYNNSIFNVNSAVIGSKLVTIRRRDSVKVNEIITGKPDVIKTKAPQIRIPLSPSFINSNFINAAPANFSTQALFMKFIKGLHLKVNEAQSSGPGGIAFLNLTDSSRLDVYYKNTNGTAIDTTLLSFPILNGSEPVAANFTHDYTGTPVQTQLNNPTTQYDVTYVQGLGGLRTKIRFPNLDKLKALGNITINKAELVVTVVDGTDNYKPSPRLLLYTTDIASQRQFIPDFGTNPLVGLTDFDFGGFYDTTNKRYKFVVTTFLQDILKGTSKQYDTFIAPVSVNYSRQSGPVASGTTASRAVIGSGKSGVTYKMKLNIFYSKIN
ncbi:DUF4270 domain-containing protein [Daejeonella lutea]|uniref:DUF4270 domain-containing protein n=1 Tax=Daejeonella lutea TaxID=572036 RepID=A0A1T5DFS3_9SPHI|nr:DUF4270 domain-containing protein [Daejeonella lutea]SKB70516.1 protein of unknown function [Daejeonella lutea]